MNKGTLDVLENISNEIDVIMIDLHPRMDPDRSKMLIRRLNQQSRRLANLVATWQVMLEKQEDGSNE